MSGQSVKGLRLSSKEARSSGICTSKNCKNRVEKGVVPTPNCLLFQIRNIIFEPDLLCDCGQASVVHISHGVFLFRICKDPFNGLLAHCVDFVATLCLSQLLHQIQVLLPDVFDQHPSLQTILQTGRLSCHISRPMPHCHAHSLPSLPLPTHSHVCRRPCGLHRQTAAHALP